MDGIITDTVRYHYQSWQQLWDEEKIPFTPDDNRDLLGLSREDSLRLILDRYGRKVTPERFQYLFDQKNVYFLRRIQGMSPADLLPGVKPLLDYLKQAQFGIAVASSSRNTRFVLERLGITASFDAIIDSNCVAKAKPAPDLFLEAAKALGVPPHAAAVIEDAAAGIAAAHNAGMLVVGVGPVERVGAADLIVPSLETLAPEQLVTTLSGIRS